MRKLAEQLQDAYAVGIHPLFVAQAINNLDAINTHLDALPARCVAIGEIGLDRFDASQAHMWEQQECVFQELLKIAQKKGLPVLVHSRKAVDKVLQMVRQFHTGGGIMHAFNGSYVCFWLG